MKPFFRKLFRVLRALGLILLVLLVMATALLTAGYWKGKREWNSSIAEATARGEVTDFHVLLPPPVPDGENIAMTPFFQPLLGPGGEEYSQKLADSLQFKFKNKNATFPRLDGMWKAERVDLAAWDKLCGSGSMADWLKTLEPQLAEASAALRLPHSRFPFDYSRVMDAPMPHLRVFLQLGKTYTLRALNALASGNTEQAFADLEALFDLDRCVKEESLLISQVVRQQLLQHAVQVLWEGLAAKRCTEDQLCAIQQHLEGIDLLESTRRSLQFELLAGMPYWLHEMRKFGASPLYWETLPQNRGWRWNPYWLPFTARRYQNLLGWHRFEERYLLATIQPAAHWVDAATISAGEAELKSKQPLPYDAYLTCMVAPPAFSPLCKMALYQTFCDEALIACALERHRLAHGAYPETLEALVPHYLARVPRDIIAGAPLHYRRTEGSFVLYSVGWNGKDDGGAPVQLHGRHRITEGDWVWRYPAAP